MKYLILAIIVFSLIPIALAESYTNFYSSLEKDQLLEVQSNNYEKQLVNVEVDLLSSNTEFNFQNCDKESFTTSFSNQQYRITNVCEKEFTLSPNKKVDNIYITGKELTTNVEMDVYGTEYLPDDFVTIFLQLRDSQGFPVNDATCSLTIYYPPRNTSDHDVYLLNAPMLYRNPSDGLYYYDISQLDENVFGVYMISAACSFATSNQFVYGTDGTDSFFPNRTDILGTYGTSEIVLNAYTDGLYSSCSADAGGTKECEAYYDFDVSGKITNESTINVMNLFYMGESSVTSTIDFYVYNWTAADWLQLPNSLTFTGLAASEPTGLNDFVSNSIPVNDTILNGTVRIRTYNAFASAYTEYSNWLNINLISEFGNAQDLRGSGEIHVSGRPTTFTRGVCPTTTQGVIFIMGILILAMAFIFIGFKSPIFGFFGAIILMITSWYLVGCIGIIGYMIALISFFLIIFYAINFKGYDVI